MQQIIIIDKFFKHFVVGRNHKIHKMTSFFGGFGFLFFVK